MKDINAVEPVNLIIQKPPLINSPVFLSAVIFYTFIMGVGFLVEPLYGLIGLFLIALISIFKILFKNLALIVGMILLGVVCTAIPFLLIIYIPILIFFFIARLGYFFEHWRVVLVGLVVYFLPVFILVQGMKSQSFLIFLIIPTILFPIAIHYFYKNYDYTVGKILELFSEAPILIISILLPFLKLGFSVGDAPVAVESHVIPDGHTVPTEALAAKPMSPVAIPVNDVPVGIEHVAIDPVTPVIVPSHINPNFNLDSFYQTLSQSHHLFGQAGSENIMSIGDKVQIGVGSDHIALVKDGFHVNVLNSEGHQIGTIENNLSGYGALEIKDTHGMKMGEIEFSQEKNAIVFKDAHNVVMASVDQSIQSDLSQSFLQAELDKTQAALDQLGNEQIPVDQVEHANKISLAMLSILAVAKERKSIDTAQAVVKDIGTTTVEYNNQLRESSTSIFRPLHSITFAKYIEEYCSREFRRHKKIFLSKRFDEIDDADWNMICESYKISKDDVAFIASTALIYKGSNGFLITKNDVIHARISGHEPVSYHLSQIAGIKKGGLTNSKNQLDRNKIFIINFDESGMKPIFKELHELLVQYRELS
ncbi:hypothetical protein ABLT82_02330 [Acinetobacter pittii]|uniref:hypothetical protein n=1 Tax=Acinetobacter pittii TaxID=48296 RepID=UPI00102349A6|nr:hypothetical protein [Acinetobacter pittii]MDC4894036.1 hypothetical protein [Acinetobacter baumannii]MDC4895825.1 hypothetical protein [Acinetobacter baumannii]MDC4899458.1 hypothetical protein [Acinetobacter baumannii]MDC4907199.1 hypothetical protein [Acinetobacter baumannii]MDC4914988.1 hypothetical protein [Acinetobacter baumannii]